MKKIDELAIGRVQQTHSCFSEMALLMRLLRLNRLDALRNVCIQFLVENVIRELGFRAYLLFTFKYWYLKCHKKW